jgi:hypothetical protein
MRKRLLNHPVRSRALQRGLVQLSHVITTARKLSTINLRALALLCVLLFSDIAAQAGDIGVINARLGVARAPRFKTEYWANLTVTIRNKGVQASAEVLYTPLSIGFTRSTTLFRKRIMVPAQAEIEISFPVLTQTDEKFLIELFVDGVAVDKQQFSASAVGMADPMVLIVDDGATAYSYFKDLKIENRKMSISIAQSRDLPEWWEVLDCLNLMVIGDVDALKMQRLNVEMLQSWLAGGGILLISTDERWTRLRGTFLEDLLPVRMYGTRPIDSIEPLGLRYGKPLEMNEDLNLCESHPAEGRVLLTLQGLPLLSYRKVGLGAVVFAAIRLDAPPLTRWAGLASLWEEIFTLREKPVEVRRTTLESRREEMLSNITGLPVPDPGFVARLLLVYIGVVVAVFVAMRYRRRLELGWASLLVVAPVAAVIYHSIGKSTRQEFKSTLNEISIVKMSGQPASEPAHPHTAWIESFHSIYSAEEATYDLRGTSEDATMAKGMVGAESAQATIPSINVVAEDVITAEKLRVNEGGLQSLKSFSSRTLDGRIASSLQWGPNGIEGEIKNELGFPLEDAMVLFNRQLIPLKKLDAGETRRISIADPKDAGYSQLIEGQSGGLDVTRKQILSALFTPVANSNYNPAQDQPVLIGWATHAVAQIEEASGRLRRKGLVAYLVSLPCQRTEGDVFIPKGVCTVRIPSALCFRQGKWVPQQGFASGAEVETEFRIPPEVRDVTVEEIQGRYKVVNPGGDMTTSIAAFDWTTGAWVEVGSANEFTLEEPWRFVLRPIGRVRLKLSVSAVRAAPVGDTPSLRAFKWQVEDLDIAIRGKLS